MYIHCIYLIVIPWARVVCLIYTLYIFMYVHTLIMRCTLLGSTFHIDCSIRVYHEVIYFIVRVYLWHSVQVNQLLALWLMYALLC